MSLILGEIEDVQIRDSPVFYDSRGKLSKLYVNGEGGTFPFKFEVEEHFLTFSVKHCFRGMHFQGGVHASNKIISIIQGEVIDFLFDFRIESNTFGVIQIVPLIEKNATSIFTPIGVAHGYLSLQENSIISYKMDKKFCGKCDSGFSIAEIQQYLPIPYHLSIRSERDLQQPEFEDFTFKTDCVNE